MPGSEYDLALLVLDAQAPPYTGSDCSAQCIGMTGANGRPADGTTLTSVGQGSASSASFTAAPVLQEVSSPVCGLLSTSQMPRASCCRVWGHQQTAPSQACCWSHAQLAFKTISTDACNTGELALTLTTQARA